MLNLFRRLCCVLVLTGMFANSVGAQEDAVNHRAAIEGMYPLMLHALQTKSFGRARNICEQAILWEPQNPVHHYNLACIDAQSGGARLAYAWGSLELAIALGFNDVDHLQTDPDLVPLHEDPKFAELVRKLKFSVSAASGFSIPIPQTKTKTSPAPSGKTTAGNKPGLKEPGARESGIPAGLYLMTRYLPATQTLERSVWYFAPDQQVFRDLKNGFSAADLAAHAGLRGSMRHTGEILEIDWSDGTATSAELESDSRGFTWDMGMFAPARAFENGTSAAGIYEGAETLAIESHAFPVAQRLELREDGSFTWEGVSFAGVAAEPRIAATANAITTGTWKLDGLSLVLTSSENVTLRRIAFPQDDEKTIIRPDHLFFAGVLYKRRP